MPQEREARVATATRQRRDSNLGRLPGRRGRSSRDERSLRGRFPKVLLLIVGALTVLALLLFSSEAMSPRAGTEPSAYGKPISEYLEPLTKLFVDSVMEAGGYAREKRWRKRLLAELPAELHGSVIVLAQ